MVALLILVRHPPADVAAGVCYGRLDLPLRDPADAARLAARVLAHAPAAVWSSPSARCRLVAEAVGAPVRVDARLLELDFGEWEGVAWDDVPRSALDAWAADPLGFAPPNGEAGAALLARVTEVAAALRAEAGRVAVVSHGGPLRLLGPLLRGEMPNLLATTPTLGSITLAGVGPGTAGRSRRVRSSS